MRAYNKGYDTYISIFDTKYSIPTSTGVRPFIKMEDGKEEATLFFKDYIIILQSEKFFIDFEYEEHAAYMYIVVVFTNRKTGKQVRNYLHRIMAYTFCKDKYVKAINYYMKDKTISVNDLDLVVDHIDGNTLNNRPNNLRYIKRSANWEASPAYAYNNEILNLKEQCLGPNSDINWLKTKQ